VSARRSLVLVAGLPGSGKSTLLAGLAPAPDVAVVDSQRQAQRLARRLPGCLTYRSYRPLVHLLHRLAIVRTAMVGPRAVVVHLPATGVRTRRALALLAAATGRTAHLVWLAVDPQEALRGQRRRRRTTPGRAFRRKMRRAARLEAGLRAGRVPPGWGQAVMVCRLDAREVLRTVLGDARARAPEVGHG